MRRRRPRASWVLLALSISLGVAITAVLQDHLAALEARARAGGDTVPVAVAARPLSRGSRLSSGDLAAGRFPEAFLPPGSVSVGEAEGRTLLADLAPGEIVTVTRLAAGGPIASLVPPGLRAVAIQVALPRKSLVPGDRVDVLATVLDGPPIAETVARGVEVVQVRRADRLEGSQGSIVFVLVSPETAERIAYMRTVSEVSLAIVGP